MGLKELWADWSEIFWLVIWFVLFAGLLPVLALFVGRGAESKEFFQAFISYSGLGSIFLLGLVALRVMELLARNNHKLYDKFGWAQTIIHDPEKGVLYNFNLKFRTWVFASIIVFGLIGLVASSNHTFFVAIPHVEQQITETGQVLLSAEPAASVETVLFLFIISILIGIVDFLKTKYNYGTIFSVLAKYLIVMPMFVLLWVSFHELRYGGAETNLLATGFFSLIGGIIIISFGTFVPWYIFHFINNSFSKATELFSNELIVLIVGIAIFMLVVTYIIIEFQGRTKERFEDFQIKGT